MGEQPLWKIRGGDSVERTAMPAGFQRSAPRMMVNGTIRTRLRETVPGVMILAQMGMAMLVSLIPKTMLEYGLSLQWPFTPCASLARAPGTTPATYALRRPGTTMTFELEPVCGT
jgi:hypothetical protein